MRYLRILFLAGFLLSASLSEAQLKLPTFFSDHMVFPKGTEDKCLGNG